MMNNAEKLLERILELKRLEVADHRMARRFIAANYPLREVWLWPEEKVRKFLQDERHTLEALR